MWGPASWDALGFCGATVWLRRIRKYVLQGSTRTLNTLHYLIESGCTLDSKQPLDSVRYGEVELDRSESLVHLSCQFPMHFTSP
jgi:hypothetical protein